MIPGKWGAEFPTLSARRFNPWKNVTDANSHFIPNPRFDSLSTNLLCTFEQLFFSRLKILYNFTRRPCHAGICSKATRIQNRQIFRPGGERGFMGTDVIREQIQAIVDEILRMKGLTPVPLNNNTRFLGDDLPIDSLDLAVVIAELQQTTGKDPFKEGFRSFQTVGELSMLYSKSPE